MIPKAFGIVLRIKFSGGRRFSASKPALTQNPKTVTGNRITRQFEQFNGVTIETLIECPNRLFSFDDKFIFQFRTSYLVRFGGIVIKYLMDFVKLDGQSSNMTASNY